MLEKIINDVKSACSELGVEIIGTPSLRHEKVPRANESGKNRTENYAYFQFDFKYKDKTFSHEFSAGMPPDKIKRDIGSYIR